MMFPPIPKQFPDHFRSFPAHFPFISRSVCFFCDANVPSNSLQFPNHFLLISQFSQNFFSDISFHSQANYRSFPAHCRFNPKASSFSANFPDSSPSSSVIFPSILKQSANFPISNFFYDLLSNSPAFHDFLLISRPFTAYFPFKHDISFNSKTIYPPFAAYFPFSHASSSIFRLIPNHFQIISIFFRRLPL